MTTKVHVKYSIIILNIKFKTNIFLKCTNLQLLQLHYNYVITNMQVSIELLLK